MTARMMKLTVAKNDGSREPYIHTKVIGTIANALSLAGQSDVILADELAEAVTFFLYQDKTRKNIPSGEILSIIETVLASTGYEAASIALSEYHYQRKLRRCRIEVSGPDTSQSRSRWNKSRIVEDLVAGFGLNRLIARTIASMVEEKVLNMGVSVVSSALVKELVTSDAKAVMYAHQQLQAV